MSLSRFNSAQASETSALLLRCCGSPRWSVRVAACRPYPDVESMLAAMDEASYDMTPQDLSEALEAETPQLPFPGDATNAADGRRGVLAAHTALRAAHAAYENRFGYAFLICLDDCHPDERLDAALAGVRARLGNDPENERIRAAEELRRLARGRLARLVVAAR
ncbi:MAG TPA: 2-oxo-4-hydroxy-4-carboxy-5-ureidoimidazoline decarboxylase [Streptomyces sp.]|nr:2-oxo-4-hydroxy-4-carboxy-5-ureidoimidazoline decarboxylase [Streptomyces sp.]